MNDKPQNKIQLYQDAQIRTLWDGDQEKWYISIVDVIEVLTDSNTPKRYWSDLKRKLKVEGNETYENIVRLKMLATDGKTLIKE